jgi:hypothetical protein
MRTTARFELAVKKLYLAFHEGTLLPECCKQCAVGNILDRTDGWRHFSDHHGSTQLNYIGIVHQRLGRTFNGYSPRELLQLESIFLKACGFDLPLLPNSKKPILQDNKDLLFIGLVAVVDYLCSLDKISNGMNCEEIFDYTFSSKETTTWQNNLTFQN